VPLNVKRLVNRLWWGCLQAIATRRDIAGIRLFAILTTGESQEMYFDKVLEALYLIGEVSPVRSVRIRRAFKSIFVFGDGSSAAMYHHDLRLCQLSDKYVRSDRATVASIAATLIHEATHGMLLDRSVPYTSASRARVERICTRAEIQFLAKCPNHADAMQTLEERLSWPDDAWSEQTHARRVLLELRKSGVPTWFVRTLARRRGIDVDDVS
jgi:hypothetical protein